MTFPANTFRRAAAAISLAAFATFAVPATAQAAAPATVATSAIQGPFWSLSQCEIARSYYGPHNAYCFVKYGRWYLHVIER
ncbi:hypothetical protein [Nonomuraea sp. NPDC046570]|uniref:hypothetical protein n=1 Tax=Nonomuraea sp. NPDC046570 TaxID=3155255 RepID=UPI00340A6777